MSEKFLVILAVAVFIGATQALPAEFVAAMLEYREKCIAVSGSEEGYRLIVDSLQPAKDCIVNRLGEEQLIADAVQLCGGPRKYFFDKYCPKLNESISCLDDILVGINKCSGDDGDQVVEIIKSMVHGLLALLCQNDGQIFFEARTPKYKACIAQLRESAVLECKVSDATKVTPISRYGEQECRDLDGALECLKKKVDECDAPKLLDIFQVIFNAISKANNCKQYTTLGEISSNNINETISGN